MAKKADSFDVCKLCNKNFNVRLKTAIQKSGVMLLRAVHTKVKVWLYPTIVFSAGLYFRGGTFFANIGRVLIFNYDIDVNSKSFSLTSTSIIDVLY